MNAWQILWQQREVLGTGLLNTIEMFVISGILSILIGSLMVWLFESITGIFCTGLRLLVDVLRMLPFLMFAYLLYYGLPQFGIRLDAGVASLLALVIYHAAYCAEIFRAARAALPKGQTEAAYAHGMSTRQLAVRILLPQLAMRSGPLLANQMINCLKDTAFLSIITIQELTSAVTSVQANYFIPTQAFIFALALYWLMSLMIGTLEKKIGRMALDKGIGYDARQLRR